MKLVWHFVILVSLVSVCASASLAQQPGNGGRGAALSLSANVIPASILELTSKSNYIEELETKSTTVRALKVTVADAETADIVKQTAAGTLLITRVEFLVRFSGFKSETATVLITLTAVADAGGDVSLIEGAGEETFKSLRPGEVIELQGVRSGTRIVRYVGFLVDSKGNPPTRENPLAATVTYELSH